MSWFENFVSQFQQAFIDDQRYMQYIKGLGVTVSVAFCALILGVIIGTFVAIIRSIHDSRRGKAQGVGDVIIDILNVLCKIYLTVIRGTPAMIQLLIMYFIVFSSTRNGWPVAVLTFGINSGAYVAEIVRSGIMSVDHGQMEAGRSLGLNYSSTMIKIIIPQAIKNILPALGNEMITLFKDTSLVNVISLRDITKAGLNVKAVTYQAFFPLIGVAVIYLIGVMIMSKLLEMFERRLRTGDRR